MFRSKRAATNNQAASRQNVHAEAPLVDHLEELRFRIIYSVIAWAIGSGIAYTQTAKIIEILKQPLNALTKNGQDIQIIVSKITDPLTTVMQVSMFGGLILVLPFIVYQVWAFVAPGLTKTERRWGGPFVLGIGFTFAIGAAFAYFVVLPVAIPFMLNFLPGVGAFFPIGDYITQILTYLGIFGLVFELPIVIFLLAKLGLVNAPLLSHFRRHAVLAIVALSAVVTPTVDPINLGLMAGPLILLYEIGILLARIAKPKNILPASEETFSQSAV